MVPDENKAKRFSLVSHIIKTIHHHHHINCSKPQGSILGSLLFLIYVSEMFQDVDCELFLYADGLCLVCQQRDVKEIEQALKSFSSVCDWLVSNKLSIHFGKDNSKSILFGTKRKLTKENSVDIRYGEIHIKQYHTVTLLGCTLDKDLLEESMVLIKAIKKSILDLDFCIRKIDFFPAYLQKTLV